MSIFLNEVKKNKKLHFGIRILLETEIQIMQK